MRKAHLYLTGALFFFLASPMYAVVYEKDTVEGYDCAGDMTTTGCFGPTATGPWATECKAQGRNNQRCRDCMEAFNTSGQSMGYKACNYVRYDAACDCYPSGRPDCITNIVTKCNYYW